jgi:RNA-directed DNA polymerase
MFHFLAKRASAEWVLEADIQGCFDKISHDWMIANIPTDKAVLKKWLKAGFVYQNELFPTDAGTPQGGIISPVLANMTLDGLEAMLSGEIPESDADRSENEHGALCGRLHHYRHSKAWLENEVKPVVVEFLTQRGLVLSPEKTKITHIKEGFDFLGWNIRKYNGKLTD